MSKGRGIFLQAIVCASTMTLLGCGASDGGFSEPNGASDGEGESLGEVQSEISLPLFAPQAYLKASNTEAGDGFGASAIATGSAISGGSAISANGDTMVVGALGEDSSAAGIDGVQGDNTASASGAAYVLIRAAGVWSQQAYLKASNPEPGDAFGSTVAISGDGNTIAIAAIGEDSSSIGINPAGQSDNTAGASGAVYIFTRAGSVWTQQAYIKASNTQAFDEFGTALALSNNGSTLAVGAHQEDGMSAGLNGNQNVDVLGADSGAAYVFTRSITTWTQQAYVKPSAIHMGDHFGRSVALSSDGSTLAVGATREDGFGTGVTGNPMQGGAPDAGAAYVFTRSGINWSQQQYFKATNAGAGDSFGRVVALSGDGNTLAASAREASNATGVNGDQLNNSAVLSGAVYTYRRSGAVWSTQAFIKASNTGANDQFGDALALSSNGLALAVGAPFEDSNATNVNGNGANESASSSGAVYTYASDGNAWFVGNYIKGFQADASDQFGSSVRLSSDGSTLAVSAPGEDSSAIGPGGDPTNNSAAGSGAVFVYTATSTPVYAQEAYVKQSNTGTNDAGGSINSDRIAVSADGTTMVVGYPNEDSSTSGVNPAQNNLAADSGAAYVYVRNAGVWTQQAFLKASNTGAGDRFGDNVALSSDGNTLVVAGYGEDSGTTGINSVPNEAAANSGAIYVFTRSGTTWTQQAYLKASNTDVDDYFGISLAIAANGNTVAVAAFGEASAGVGVNSATQADDSAPGSGAVYIFTRSITTWSQQAYVKASNTESGDAFGVAIALSGTGTTLAVGAQGEDSNSSSTPGNNSSLDSGAAYVFTRSGSVWSQQKYLKAAAPGANDFYGWGVSLSSTGDRLAVGATGEDSAAHGVNGNPANESAPESGAVYLYDRTAGVWGSQTYFKPTNAGGGFGQAVRISADGVTLAISALFEANEATGVNPPQTGTGAVNSGAVYTFTKLAGGWTPSTYLKASNSQAGDAFGAAIGISSNGSILVVASSGEDSSATGINGNQTSNAALESGAAYVFSR